MCTWPIECQFSKDILNEVAYDTTVYDKLNFIHRSNQVNFLGENFAALGAALDIHALRTVVGIMLVDDFVLVETALTDEPKYSGHSKSK